MRLRGICLALQGAQRGLSLSLSLSVSICVRSVLAGTVIVIGQRTRQQEKLSVHIFPCVFLSIFLLPVCIAGKVTQLNGQ